MEIAHKGYPYIKHYGYEKKIAYDKFALFLPILNDYAYEMYTNCFRACNTCLIV